MNAESKSTQSLSPALQRRTVLATLAASMVVPSLSIRALAQDSASAAPPLINSITYVKLEGVYPQHVQGVCSNDRDRLYWSMTNSIVMTDTTGKILKHAYAPHHQGDLCYLDGKIYVGVNKGVFNDSQKRADSWIYVFDANDLSLLSRKHIPEVGYGAGGIAFGNGKFLVVGGLPNGHQENKIFEYDRNLNFIREINLKSGWTNVGIQTVAYSGNQWWFGCYGKPEVLIRTDRDFKKIQRFEFNGSVGLVPISGKGFLVGISTCSSTGTCEAALKLVDLEGMISSGTLKPS